MTVEIWLDMYDVRTMGLSDSQFRRHVQCLVKWAALKKRLHRKSRRRYVRGNASLAQVLKRVGEMRCAYCGALDQPLQIEHLIPVSRGGTNDLGNLTLACKPCNCRKNTKTAAEFGFPHLMPDTATQATRG